MMGEQIPGAGYGTTLAPAGPGSGSTAPSSSAGSEPDGGFTLWDSDGFSFGDLLDVVNPLQHIPVISTLYRDLTGDDIGHAARVLGGALFGGPIGAAASFANVVIDEVTGDDLGGHALALVKDMTGPGDEPASGDPAMVADAAWTSAFAGGAERAWVPSQTALANAVEDGDYLLVAREVGPGTMNEPAELAWVRIPKDASPAATASEERPAAVRSFEAPSEGAQREAGDGPSGAQPELAPARRQAPAADMNPSTVPPDAAAGAAVVPQAGTTQTPAGQDPMLDEAEALFRLGLQYEPGSQWGRVSGVSRQDDQKHGADPVADPVDAPTNPLDRSALPAQGGEWVANAMRQGLEKYHAMSARTDAPGSPAIDVDL